MLPQTQQTLMYSFDQVARELDMVDVVLKRLCQTFKIPQSAFQSTTGQATLSLPYKGDLLFSLPDIRRLQTIQDAIERGKPIKVIQHELQQAQRQGSVDFLQEQIERSKFLSTLQYLEQPITEHSSPPRTRITTEIKPIEDVAKESFDRYKHREAPQSPILKAIAQHITEADSETPLPPSPSGQALDWMPPAEPLIETLSTSTNPEIAPPNKAPVPTQTETPQKSERKSSGPPGYTPNFASLSELFPKRLRHKPFKPWEIEHRGYHPTAKVWPEQKPTHLEPMKPNAFRNNVPQTSLGNLDRIFQKKRCALKQQKNTSQTMPLDTPSNP